MVDLCVLFILAVSDLISIPIFVFVGLGVKMIDGWGKISGSEWHAVGGN